MKYNLAYYDDTQIVINRNMRCIEIKRGAVHDGDGAEINRNMRCIEIEQAEQGAISRQD